MGLLIFSKLSPEVLAIRFSGLKLVLFLGIFSLLDFNILVYERVLLPETFKAEQFQMTLRVVALKKSLYVLEFSGL